LNCCRISLIQSSTAFPIVPANFDGEAIFGRSLRDAPLEEDVDDGRCCCALANALRRLTSAPRRCTSASSAAASSGGVAVEPDDGDGEGVGMCDMTEVARRKGDERDA